MQSKDIAKIAFQLPEIGIPELHMHKEASFPVDPINYILFNSLGNGSISNLIFGGLNKSLSLFAIQKFMSDSKRQKQKLFSCLKIWKVFDVGAKSVRVSQS